MVEQVTKYRAPDGTLFDSEQAALEYDQAGSRIKAISVLLRETFQQGMSATTMSVDFVKVAHELHKNRATAFSAIYGLNFTEAQTHLTELARIAQSMLTESPMHPELVAEYSTRIGMARMVMSVLFDIEFADALPGPAENGDLFQTPDGRYKVAVVRDGSTHWVDVGARPNVVKLLKVIEKEDE